MMNTKIIRSARKTLAIEIRPDGVIVRAPLRASKSQINSFLKSRAGWIEKHTAMMLERQAKLANIPKLNAAELKELAQQAKARIPERVRYYAPLIGVDYGRITIRAQRSRWGSCSDRGNLNFNCLLMLTPPEVLDSVVVHELCHRKEMNHSPRFYAEVRRVFPEYDKWHGWLKEHGGELLAQLTI